ncbi:hypothetical protein CRM95_13860 [Burkholderia gladioli]|nr:hypothetical protein CRM95_13860 [Burkholderia gladioli]
MSAGPFDFIQDKTEALPTIAAPGHHPDALQCYLLLPAPGTLQCYLRQFDFAHREQMPRSPYVDLRCASAMANGS